MYVCVHVCVHVCVYVRMYLRTYVRLYVCTYVTTYACVSLIMFVWVRVYVYQIERSDHPFYVLMLRCLA